MTEVGFDSALGAAYQLVEVVGRGATGEVWRAVDRRTGEIVAAKLLRAEHVADRDLVARFIRERSVLTELRHPNLVAVRDLVVEGDRLAIVMDYVGGGTLRDVLRDQGPLRPELAVAVVAEVLDGLAAHTTRGSCTATSSPTTCCLTGVGAPGAREPPAHRLRHRPDRRRRRRHHHRAARHSRVHVAGAADDRRRATSTDVYGVGILLYELLAGSTPFAGPGTDYTVAHRHVSSVPPGCRCLTTLWAVLADLLEKDPGAVRRPRPRPSHCVGSATGWPTCLPSPPRRRPATSPRREDRPPWSRAHARPRCRRPRFRQPGRGRPGGRAGAAAVEPRPSGLGHRRATDVPTVDTCAAAGVGQRG